MICPLMSKVEINERDYGTEFIPAECQWENCGWWDRNGEICSVVSVACFFGLLEEIRDRIAK